ncbi:MAG: hypothetical protein V7637_1279 [Mycobacteriales bacterium]|jgi:hypothetical protein
MPTIETTFSTVAGTQAAIGAAGRHTPVVDPPDGVAPGRGPGSVVGVSGGRGARFPHR